MTFEHCPYLCAFFLFNQQSNAWDFCRKQMDFSLCRQVKPQRRGTSTVPDSWYTARVSQMLSHIENHLPKVQTTHYFCTAELSSCTDLTIIWLCEVKVINNDKYIKIHKGQVIHWHLTSNLGCFSPWILWQIPCFKTNSTNTHLNSIAKQPVTAQKLEWILWSSNDKKTHYCYLKTCVFINSVISRKG